MARIMGTRRDNFLSDTLDNDVVFGFQGNDTIRCLAGGLDEARGGRGDDEIEIGGAGLALGGVGDDALSGRGATLGGGPGHDNLWATGGALYGDAVPGERESRKAGNDTLGMWMTGDGTMTGGAGADTFCTSMLADGVARHATVTDFRAGEDKAHLDIYYLAEDGALAGRLPSAGLFWILDGNGDGMLVGGEATWSPHAEMIAGEGGLTIRVHDDTLTFAGVDRIAAEDWLFV